MFHVPRVAGASWGANLRGSPVILDGREVPEPQKIFMVPVSHWSDGTSLDLPEIETFSGARLRETRTRPLCCYGCSATTSPFSHAL